MKVIRIETHKSKWGGKEHIRAMSRGRLFTPGEKVVGATITLEGDDPQKLKTYMEVQDILRQEEQKLGLFGKQYLWKNLYESRRKPGMWEAQWRLV